MGRCLKQTKQHTHNGGRRVWGGVGGLGWWWLEEGAVHGAGWGNGAGWMGEGGMGWLTLVELDQNSFI